MPSPPTVGRDPDKGARPVLRVACEVMRRSLSLSGDKTDRDRHGPIPAGNHPWNIDTRARSAIYPTQLPWFQSIPAVHHAIEL